MKATLSATSRGEPVSWVAARMSAKKFPIGGTMVLRLMRKVRHRGSERVGWMFVLACAVYNLVRLRTLLAMEATA